MKFFCKIDNKLHEVYKIRCDKVGFPQFLIYMNHEWKWLSAKNFTPMESEEIEERYCNEMQKVFILFLFLNKQEHLFLLKIIN